MIHPEELARKIACTQRKILRLENRGKGNTRECQRLREILDELRETQQENCNGA